MARLLGLAFAGQDPTDAAARLKKRMALLDDVLVD